MECIICHCLSINQSVVILIQGYVLVTFTLWIPFHLVVMLDILIPRKLGRTTQFFKHVLLVIVSHDLGLKLSVYWINSLIQGCQSFSLTSPVAIFSRKWQDRVLRVPKQD